MKILVVMDVDAKQKQWLETAAPEADFCYCPGDGTQAGKALDEAMVLARREVWTALQQNSSQRLEWAAPTLEVRGDPAGMFKYSLLLMEGRDVPRDRTASADHLEAVP